jgi:hypothetical protein
MFVQNGNLPNCHSPLQQKLQNIPWCYISFHWKMKQVTFDTWSTKHEQRNNRNGSQGEHLCFSRHEHNSWAVSHV